MESKNPKEFFEKTLPAKFNPAKTAGIDITAQIKITGANSGDWIVTIKDQKLMATQGTHPSPTLTLEVAENDFMDIVNGKQSGERAFFSGKVRLNGNIVAALKLRQAGLL